MRTSNECTGYNTKQADGETPVLLEVWGMCNTLSLSWLTCTVWPGVIAPDRAQIIMGQIELLDI